MSPRRPQAGLTLIELMVSLALVSIAVGLTFRIFATSSVALRGQTRVSNLQTSLRSAKQLLAKDLRMAGYMAAQLSTQVDAKAGGFGGGGANVDWGPALAANPNGTWMVPLAINNSAEGPDSFRVVYADPTRCSARVTSNFEENVGFTSTVDTADCFQVGDVIAVVQRQDVENSDTILAGTGCILQVTKVDGLTIEHAGGSPWNATGNKHCAKLYHGTQWWNGATMYHLVRRAYRIKPDDARGVLQMSTSGGMEGTDWTDVALGFTDIQLAVRQVVQTRFLRPPHNVDPLAEPDPAPAWSWLSGENMESPLRSVERTAGEVITTSVTSVTLSLVGKIDSDGLVASESPNLNGEGGDTTAETNSLGDHSPQDLKQVTDRSSPLYGNVLFRTLTTMIDLRNMATGIQES